MRLIGWAGGMRCQYRRAELTLAAERPLAYLHWALRTCRAGSELGCTQVKTWSHKQTGVEKCGLGQDFPLLNSWATPFACSLSMYTWSLPPWLPSPQRGCRVVTSSTELGTGCIGPRWELSSMPPGPCSSGHCKQPKSSSEHTSWCNRTPIICKTRLPRHSRLSFTLHHVLPLLCHPHCTFPLLCLFSVIYRCLYAKWSPFSSSIFYKAFSSNLTNIISCYNWFSMKRLLGQDNSLGFYFGIGCTVALHNLLKQKVPAFS